MYLVRWAHCSATPDCSSISLLNNSVSFSFVDVPVGLFDALNELLDAHFVQLAREFLFLRAYCSAEVYGLTVYEFLP